MNCEHTPAQSPASPERPLSGTESPARGRWAWLLGQEGGYLLILVLAVVLIYLFWGRDMRFFMVPSRSMEPTLYPADHLVTLRQNAYAPGDIVVLLEQDANEYVVKRIVALGGDQVTVRDGALFRNGAYVSEPYIAEPMKYTIDTPVTVPEGAVFLLGDNRNNSDDSHLSLKSQPVDAIVGKVRFRYYPYHRWGVVRSLPSVHTDKKLAEYRPAKPSTGDAPAPADSPQ